MQIYMSVTSQLKKDVIIDKFVILSVNIKNSFIQIIFSN